LSQSYHRVLSLVRPVRASFLVAGILGSAIFLSIKPRLPYSPIAIEQRNARDERQIIDNHQIRAGPSRY